MRLQEKVNTVQNELIDALCNIGQIPENLFPHPVFVEEENESGEPVYNKYQLLQIIPERRSCILFNPRTRENEEEETYLTAINIDWLVTVWDRYLELSSLPEQDTEPQLWAFVWNLKHLLRNVSDEELLKEWETSSDDDYQVVRYSPDELAAQINDERFNDLELSVRFIKL